MSILTNKFLARRDFIKGLVSAGVLSGLQAERVFAQTTTAPLRICIIPLAHGWGEGLDAALKHIVGNDQYDFTLPPYWTPFNDIRDQCAFIDGLRGAFWGNAHTDSFADMLTAAAPYNSPMGTTTGPSIDYLLEKNSGKSAIRVGGWEYAYDDKFQEIQKYRSPHELYDALFKNAGGTVPTSPSVDPALKELFPFLSAEGNHVLSTINTTNTTARNKVLSYLDAVTAVQNRVSPAQTISSGTATVKKIPGPGQETDYSLSLDMVRVAFTNDTHRIALVGADVGHTFQWTDTQGNTRTGSAGLSNSEFSGDFHQNVAHDMFRNADSGLAWDGHIRHEARVIVNFINDLKNTVDFDGKPLIDNTIVILTGEIGNGSHEVNGRSHIVIGGGSRIKHNRWLHLERVKFKDVGTRDAQGKLVTIADYIWYQADFPVVKSSYGDLYSKIGQIAGLGSNFKLGFDVMNVAPIDL
jgi:hypothetical protein